MNYATIQNTIYQLLSIQQSFSKPNKWRQSWDLNENAVTLDEAFHLVGIDDTAYIQNLDKDNIYPGSLNRGEIPEPVWFVRQAMDRASSEFDGLICKWNDAPGRKFEEVLDLIASAIDLAKTELAQILASDEGFDTRDIVLHRWADEDGSQLCAMSALSQKLGYEILTDIPKEVDPGLAALVNLLNDRANDKARQLLVSRLRYIPNTGRTDICNLIGRVFFPQSISGCGYDLEASRIAKCKNNNELANTYSSLSERFIEPDGVGYLASGSMTLSAALNNSDPIKQDLLAVSAASQLVSFEMGWGWVDLLHILDFILDLVDDPCPESGQLFAKYGEYFEENKPFSEADEIANQNFEEEKRPFIKIYDFGIKVQWFPALAEKFPDQLNKIAEKILDEVTALGSVTIYTHRFSFEDEEVMIVTSWDDELDMLFADADLVAYQDAIGEVDIDGDGDTETVLMPIPASEAETRH